TARKAAGRRSGRMTNDDLQARQVQAGLGREMPEVWQARQLRRVLVQVHVAGPPRAGIHEAGQRQSRTPDGVSPPDFPCEGRSWHSRAQDPAYTFGVLYQSG